MDTVRRRVGSVSRTASDAVQRRHRPDHQITLFMGLLMLFGLVIMYAIGPQRANVMNEVHGTDFYNETYFVFKQALSLFFAIVAFIIASQIKFSVLKKYALQAVKVGFLLCILLFIGGNILHIDAIAVSTLGAYRWFNLGPLGTFQPAEVLKLGLLLYLATFLGKRVKEGAINDTQRTVYPTVIVAAAALLMVVVLQKDMGTGLALGSMIFMMLVMSGMKWKIIGQIALIAMIIGTLLIVFVPHRRERLMTFLSGDSASSATHTEAQDNNYHIKNAMIALGTGSFLGLGIGKSVQAAGYLPEAINDSVFAIIGETFGFVGVTIVILIFLALLLRILRISDHMPDVTMRLAVAGVFGWLAAHVILNIASMIGLVPLTGITLPLLSFGGTSMVFISGALGLVYQLSRYTSHETVMVKEAIRENTSSRRGIGGTRYSSRRRPPRN